MTQKYSETELKLLHSWKDRTAGWRWLHYESMNHYKTINARFVHLSIILSTLAGAGGFTTAGTSDNKFGVMQMYMGYIIGATNIFIGLLNSFQRFGKAAEKTELHQSAAMQYAMLTRLLDTELSLTQDHMKSDLISLVRQEMDRLLSQSPTIPQKIIDRFNNKFPNIDHKPDICSDFGDTKSTSDFFRDIISTPIHKFTNMLRIRINNKERSIDNMSKYSPDLEFSQNKMNFDHIELPIRSDIKKSISTHDFIPIKEVKENSPTKNELA